MGKKEKKKKGQTPLDFNAQVFCSIGEFSLLWVHSNSLLVLSEALAQGLDLNSSLRKCHS